jgi:haloacetate dehalogenase
MARCYWHWLFHFQPNLPDLLIYPNVEAYLRYLFERWTYNLAAFDSETVAECVRSYSAPGALRGCFSDYRATFPDDMDADNASAMAGQKFTMSVLMLWGANDLIGAI